MIAVMAIVGALCSESTSRARSSRSCSLGGTSLERFAVARARRELSALLKRAPRIAHRRSGTGVVDVDVDQVILGDLLVVKPGEVVPADGILTSDDAILDESALGIYDGATLRAQTREFLHEHFGKSTDYYYWMARGVDHRAVEPDRPRKSIGSETTFDRDLSTHEELVAGIRPAIESVWGDCEKNGLSGRTVTLKVRYADFQRITRSQTAPAPAAACSSG